MSAARAIALGIALASLAACGGAGASSQPVEVAPLPPGEPVPTPAPRIDDDDPAPVAELTPDELEPIMTRWHASMESLGDVFDAAEGDCAALAANLDAWVVDNRPALAELASDVARVPDAQWEELVAARAEAEPELLRPLQTGYLACSDHPDFQAVTDRIDALVY